MDVHHALNYAIGVAGLVTAITAVGIANHKPPQIVRTVVQASQVAPTARPSRAAWPALGQAATIKIGEALAKAREDWPDTRPWPNPTVTIYCNSSDCDALMHDLDDALQIAEWESDFERAHVDAESEPGLFIGPKDSPVAKALMDALAQFHPQPVETTGPAIIIGKKP